jgi:hypothetical protein
MTRETLTFGIIMTFQVQHQSHNPRMESKPIKSVLLIVNPNINYSFG